MFASCSKLLVIYVSSSGWNTDNVTTHTDMFLDDTNLTGGNGTRFSSTYINKTRAVIDVSGTPGYLSTVPISNVLEHGTSGDGTTKYLSTNTFAALCLPIFLLIY